VKACPDFQQRSDAPEDVSTPARRYGDARKNFQQRALPRAVQSDDAGDFTTFNLKRNVFERPDVSISVLPARFETAERCKRGGGDRVAKRPVRFSRADAVLLA
jgi:hypothetical protein